MKKKHQGLTSILLFVVAVGTAVAFLFSGYWRTGDFSSGSEAAPFATGDDPGQNLFYEIRKLNDHLDFLVQPAPADTSEVDLVLFGYHKPNPVSSGTSGNEPPSPDPVDYRLSFAFASAHQQFCILDGNFYTAGHVLPDGAKILTIKPNRVLIGKDHLERWITPPTQSPDASRLSAIDTTPNQLR
jgi:hypothetical protein